MNVFFINEVNVCDVVYMFFVGVLFLFVNTIMMKFGALSSMEFLTELYDLLKFIMVCFNCVISIVCFEIV